MRNIGPVLQITSQEARHSAVPVPAANGAPGLDIKPDSSQISWHGKGELTPALLAQQNQGVSISLELQHDHRHGEVVQRRQRLWFH
jgi:hypothetical protein